jgi:hypothetical protein
MGPIPRKLEPIDPFRLKALPEWHQVRADIQGRCAGPPFVGPDCDEFFEFASAERANHDDFCASERQYCNDVQLAKSAEFWANVGLTIETAALVVSVANLVPGDEAAVLAAQSATLSGRPAIVSRLAGLINRGPARDLRLAEAHLGSIKGGLTYPPNAAMLDSIRQTINTGQGLSSAQRTFLDHEILESHLVRGGIRLERAHPLVQKVYPPGSNYAPEIMKMFPEHFNDLERSYWGISR